MKNNRLYQIRMPSLRAFFAAMFVFVSANPALAQDWRFEPIFRVGGVVDDNATLNPRTDQEADVSGLLADVQARLYYTSPTSSFLVQPSVVTRNYNDDVISDSDDFFLRSTFRRRTEQSTIGFRVRFDSQSVRSAERLETDLEIDDPDEITNDDTGRVLRVGDRTRWRASPYFEYQLSNLSSIRAGLNYINTQYDDVFAGLLADFSDARLSLNYRRSLSNVTSWKISLSGRTYDSESLPEEITGYGLSTGLDYALSEKTRISAAVGIEETNEPGFETDPEISGRVRLIHNLETIRFFAEYRRSVYGSGAGNVSVRDSLNLNFRRRLSEKISAGLGVRAYQTGRVGSSSFVDDRNYIQLRWNLSWYLTRSFVIEADYRYTVIDRDETLGGRANSNRVGLWFVYQPKTIPKI